MVKKVFGATTTYDFYVIDTLKNISDHKTSILDNEKCITCTVSIKGLEFIPNAED